MNPKKSGRGKHSYVPFYMDDWYGGTARMTRLVKSVYFDICLYTWDKAQPVPEAELMLMLDDLGPQGEQIVNMLVKSGRLERTVDGEVYSKRALVEAQKAFDLWQAKSGGGRRGSAATNAAKGGDDTPDESRQQNHNQTHNQNPTDDIGGSAPLSSGDDDTGGDAAAGAGEGEGEKPVKVVRKTYAVEPIVNAWNDMAGRNKGIAGIRKLTEERRKKIRARLEDHTEAEMIEAIGLIPQRPFCMGQNDRKWFADIDFLLRPNTVTRILEGSAYMDGSKGGWADA